MSQNFFLSFVKTGFFSFLHMSPVNGLKPVYKFSGSLDDLMEPDLATEPFKVFNRSIMC